MLNERTPFQQPTGTGTLKLSETLKGASSPKTTRILTKTSPFTQRAL